MTSPLEHLLPEPPRLDRHDTYVGILIYVWLAAIGIYLLPIATGVMATLDPVQQKALAVCMFLGSTLCLVGSASGEPVGIKIVRPIQWVLRSRLAERIRHHPYQPLPVRHCYRLGVAGLVANVTAFAFFSGQLLTTGSIIGSMTGLLPPILVVTWTRKARKLWKLAGSMDEDFERLKKDVKENGGQ